MLDCEKSTTGSSFYLGETWGWGGVGGTVNDVGPATTTSLKERCQLVKEQEVGIFTGPSVCLLLEPPVSFVMMLSHLRPRPI